MEPPVLERLKAIDDLPTLPSVALEVLSLAHRPDVTIQLVAECIHRDPPLAAKVLRMANSTFYRRGDRQVETLHRAILFLGLAEIINITTSLSVFSALTSRRAVEVSIREQFWDHSVATGLMARHVDKKLQMRSLGREFVAGLLHDVGKIILDQYFHEEFMAAYNLSREQDRPMYETEMATCGTNHMEVGYYIARKWNLPPYLQDVILWHHKPSRAAFPDMAAVVSVADHMARAAQFSCGADTMPFVLADQDAWAVLKERGVDVNGLDVERMTFEMEAIGHQVKEYIETVMNPEEGGSRDG